MSRPAKPAAKKNKLALTLELTDFPVYDAQNAAEAANATMMKARATYYTMALAPAHVD